jgi:hypothetical protein
VWKGSSQGQSVRFKLEPTAGVTMSYLSETHFESVLEGDLFSGITYCLTECKPHPILLARIDYMTFGTSDACSEVRAVPRPGSTTIETIDCDGFLGFAAGGGRLVINQTVDCGVHYCNDFVWYGPPANPSDFCASVSTDVTSWGAVKSMYSQ